MLMAIRLGGNPIKLQKCFHLLSFYPLGFDQYLLKKGNMMKLHHIHSPNPLGGMSVLSCLFQLLPTVFQLSESSSSKKKGYYI